MGESTTVNNTTRRFQGLPPHWYTDPEIWALEVERIWRRQWHCVGRAEQVAEPGDYLCFDFIGEPLAMVRGTDDVVRVLSTVCRHRAMLVLQGSGNTQSIVCPYHSWNYDLDGRLRGAPEMQQTPGFSVSECQLPEIRSEVWEGFVFVNLDPNAQPLGAQLSGLSAALRNYRLAEMKTVRRLPFEGLCKWNWKLECDNYIEGYHHIGAHKESLEPVMAGRDTYELESDGAWSVLRMPYRPGCSPFVDGVHVDCGMPALATLEPAERDSVTVVHIFPGTKISLWGGHMDFYRMFPIGADTFVSEKDYCVPPSLLQRNDLDSMIQALVDGFLAFRHEDDDLCVAVQRGLNSRYAQTAQLCHLEGTVDRFASWVETQMGIAAES